MRTDIKPFHSIVYPGVKKKSYEWIHNVRSLHTADLNPILDRCEAPINAWKDQQVGNYIMIYIVMKHWFHN